MRRSWSISKNCIYGFCRSSFIFCGLILFKTKKHHLHRRMCVAQMFGYTYESILLILFQITAQKLITSHNFLSFRYQMKKKKKIMITSSFLTEFIVLLLLSNVRRNYFFFATFYLVRSIHFTCIFFYLFNSIWTKRSCFCFSVFCSLLRTAITLVKSCSLFARSVVVIGNGVLIIKRRW